LLSHVCVLQHFAAEDERAAAAAATGSEGRACRLTTRS
jgi:hypothetical protein